MSSCVSSSSSRRAVVRGSSPGIPPPPGISQLSAPYECFTSRTRPAGSNNTFAAPVTKWPSSSSTIAELLAERELPARLPGEVTDHQLVQVTTEDQMLERPAVGRVSNEQHASAIPLARYVAEQIACPTNYVLVALPSGPRDVNVIGPPTLEPFARHSVEGAVVALAESAVDADRKVAIGECNPHRLEGAFQVRDVYRGDAVVTATLAQLACGDASGVGQTSRQPARGDAVLVVRGYGVRLIDDAYRHLRSSRRRIWRDPPRSLFQYRDGSRAIRRLSLGRGFGLLGIRRQKRIFRFVIFLSLGVFGEERVLAVGAEDAVAVGLADERVDHSGCQGLGLGTCLRLSQEDVDLLLAEALRQLAAGECLGCGAPGSSPSGSEVLRRARPGRDELADDDVLLEADEVVLGAVDGGLGQHPRRLLEGGCGEERRRVQRRLGDAQQNRLGRGRLATLGDDAVVDLLEVELVDELERQLLRVTGLIDAHLAQHLPNDDLDVLVVDRHTL